MYFCILVPINKFRDVTEALLAKTKLAEERSKEQTILLLQQIRDELAKQNARNTQNVPNDSDTVAGAVAVR